MNNLLQDAIDRLWPGEEGAPPAPSIAGIGAKPGFRPARTPAESKAEETTRAAREITDAENDARRSRADQLRRARLEREAMDRAAAAAAPAPKTARRARKA